MRVSSLGGLEMVEMGVHMLSVVLVCAQTHEFPSLVPAGVLTPNAFSTDLVPRQSLSC